MNDSYEVFPKVVSVGQQARVVIRGLRARTISPGWIHNVEICSMTNHADFTRIKALAIPPADMTSVSEPSRGGVIEFYHTFATRGEYRIIVRWDDETTKYVIRDNDGIFSKEFKETIKRFGLKDTPTAPRSPWQNPICERVIGTLRRDCLDHMIILNEKHLYDVLHEYIFEYYNVSRTHMSLYKDSPVHRPTQTNGKIKAKPILGGLHHIYSRAA